MLFLAGFFVFCLGAIVGSFLNVVVLRFGTGKSIAFGRSECFSCGKNLKWYELVPIVSFLFLRGRCSRCLAKISWQYPLVEFLTGVLFLAVALKYSFLPENLAYIMASFAVMSSLVAIAVYDFKHKIIPDGFVLAFCLFSFIFLLLGFSPTLFTDQFYILNLLCIPIVFSFFYLLWFFSGGRWIGFGDAKLAIGIGLLLGVGSLSAIILAFWIGAGISVLLIVISKTLAKTGKLKGLNLKSEIPFAPFLILGTLLVFFFQIDILGIRLLLGF